MAGIGILLIMLPVIYFTRHNLFFKIFFNMNMGYPAIIEVFIYKFLWNFFYIKVLNHLSPFHVVLVSLLLSIYAVFETAGYTGKLYWAITCLLVIFGFLIYTESLIINAFGLSYNCEINIKKRGEDDFGNLIEDNKGMHSDSETVSKSGRMIEIGDVFLNEDND